MARGPTALKAAGRPEEAENGSLCDAFQHTGIKRRGRRATQHGKEACRLDQQASPHGEGVMAHGHTFYPDIKEG